MLTLTLAQSNRLIQLLPMQVLFQLQYEVVDENTIIPPEDFLCDDQFKILCVLFAKENFTCTEVDFIADSVVEQEVRLEDFYRIKNYMIWKGLLHVNKQDGTVTLINDFYRPSEYVEQKELALTRKADAEVERITTAAAKLELIKQTTQEKATQTEPELSIQAVNDGVKHKSVQPIVINDEKTLPKSRKRKIQSTFSINSLLGLKDTQIPVAQPLVIQPQEVTVQSKSSKERFGRGRQRDYASLFQKAFTDGLLTKEIVMKRYSELTADPQSKGRPKPHKKQPNREVSVKPKEIISVSSPHLFEEANSDISSLPNSDLIVVDAPRMGLVPAFEFSRAVTNEIPSEEISSDISMQARSGSDSNSQPVEDSGLTVMDKEEFAIYQNQKLKNLPNLFSQSSQLSGSRNKMDKGHGESDGMIYVRKMA